MVLNTVNNRLDGVQLIRGTASHYVGIAQRQVLPTLEAQLGKATIFSSTICRQKLPVTVARWHDLSLAFENGTFAELVYNYRGWPVAFNRTLPLPPAGVALAPFIKADFGVTVGDSAAKVKSLDPRTRGISATSLSAGVFTNFNMAKRAGAPGTSDTTYQVAQIEVATGNC